MKAHYKERRSGGAILKTGIARGSTRKITGKSPLDIDTSVPQGALTEHPVGTKRDKIVWTNRAKVYSLDYELNISMHLIIRAYLEKNDFYWLT